VVLPLLDRIADDGRLRGEYLNNMGAVSLGHGEWDAAEAQFVAAIVAKTAGFGPDSGELVYTHANLGTLRSNLHRTGAAIEALQAAVTVGDRAFGAEHPIVLRVRANLGMVLLRHSRVHDAEATLLAVRAAADPPRPSRSSSNSSRGSPATAVTSRPRGPTPPRPPAPPTPTTRSPPPRSPSCSPTSPPPRATNQPLVATTPSSAPPSRRPPATRCTRSSTSTSPTSSSASATTTKPSRGPPPPQRPSPPTPPRR
jgi:hypothetical protein